MKMTPREALKIQAEQVEWYGKTRPWLAEAVRAKTNVEGLNLDDLIEVTAINERIPRGSEIEFMCGITQPND